MKTSVRHQVASELGRLSQSAFVIVNSEFAGYFRPPPNDGRTYIIQDARRPWFKHVSGPGINYTIDERDPKLRVTSNANGERVRSDKATSFL